MTVPAIPAVGDPATAAWADIVAGGFDAWTFWTPALTASTTNPTLGTGSAAFGYYQQIGKTITGWGQITFGTSGTAVGSGTYAVSLPVSAFATQGLMGAFRVRCAGLFTRGDLVSMTSTTGNLAYTSAAVNGSQVFATSATPGAWSTNDFVQYMFTYQAA